MLMMFYYIIDYNYLQLKYNIVVSATTHNYTLLYIFDNNRIYNCLGLSQQLNSRRYDCSASALDHVELSYRYASASVRPVIVMTIHDYTAL